MRIPGRRVRRVRLVRTAKYVVAVRVQAVYPEDDAREACYESETVKLLHEVQERAEREDLKWLRRRGKVYQAIEA
jgi:hypothetical protein